MAPAVTADRRSEGFAVATIAREPVNSMDLGLWRELLATLEQLEADKAVRGVIWASGLKRDVFTAGNDLKELHAPSTSRARHADFWVTQTTFLARLRRSPLITVAAIRGACPAGGCCMALCCDVRVMTEGGQMGLNEVALGIPVPDFWAQNMVRVIGAGRAGPLLQFAKLVSPQEALQLGLVDRVVPALQLLPAAEAAMKQVLALPDWGRQITKERLHGDFGRAWEEQAEAEAVEAWAMLETPAVTKALGGVIARLQGKAKASKL